MYESKAVELRPFSFNLRRNLVALSLPISRQCVVHTISYLGEAEPLTPARYHLLPQSLIFSYSPSPSANRSILSDSVVVSEGVFLASITGLTPGHSSWIRIWR